MHLIDLIEKNLLIALGIYCQVKLIVCNILVVPSCMPYVQTKQHHGDKYLLSFGSFLNPDSYTDYN